MKKTLLITLDFYPKIGGVANYYFNLGKNLPREKIMVLTDGKTSEEGDLGFKIFREELLRPNVWPHWWPMFGAIKRIIRQEKIERLWVGDIWPTGMVVFLIAKLFKIPYIISCHGKDLLLVKKNRLKKYLGKIVLKRAMVVTANSQSTGRIVESLGVGKGKIKVVYPGVGQENKKTRKQENKKLRNQEIKAEIIQKYKLEEKRILLSVGRLVERKGFDQVIEAWPKITSEVKNLVYVIVGDGPDRGRLEQEIEKLEDEPAKFNVEKSFSSSGSAQTALAGSLPLRAKTKNQIIFVGQVNDEEKWAWLDLCDVFIMPARESETDVEGFGIVYLEAALAGKPVIAGKSGGASEAVVDGQTGILVDPENIQEIAGVTVGLLKNEELSKKMGEQGKERAEKDFNWEKLANQMRDVLK